MKRLKFVSCYRNYKDYGIDIVIYILNLIQLRPELGVLASVSVHTWNKLEKNVEAGEVDDEKNVDVISRLIYYGVKTLC